MKHNETSLDLRSWTFFFLLAFAEAALALVRLVTIPREAGGGALFGFSPTRLAILAFLLLVLIILAVLTWFSWRRPSWRARWLDPAVKPVLHAWVHALSIAGMLLAAGASFWLQHWDPERWGALFTRAQPPLLFLFVFCAQLALFLLFLRTRRNQEAWRSRRGVYIVALIVLAVFLLAAVVIAWSGLGMKPDPVYWSVPGVPLLGWQTVLAVIGGWLILLAGLKPWIQRHARSFDLLLGLAVWALAFYAWMQVPLSTLKSSFYAPIWPPYDLPFPYSDAGMYDYLARSLLLGNGLYGMIPPRPLYIALLAGIQAIFGGSYAQTAMGQTMLLALFPAVLYFLGKALHSRAAGLTVALLAVFRELNSLWVASDIEVANSKMFLSDLPMTLAGAVFLLLAVHWLSRRQPRSWHAFLAGGVFGLLLLLRTQVIFTLVGVTLVLLVGRGISWKKKGLQLLLFACGLVLAAAPWLVRNHALTGVLTMEDPTQAAWVAGRYGQGTEPAGSLAGSILQGMVRQPGVIVGFVSNHFLANEIDTLLVLPLAGLADGFHEPIETYWLDVEAVLSPGNLPALFLYMALIAVGVGAAWKHLRWAGLLPLLFHVTYALSNGLARISGWRYNLPADWVGYFYFAVGVIELICGAALLFGAQDSRLFSRLPADATRMEGRAPRGSAWKWAAASALFVLAGSLPVIMEHAIPDHFATPAPQAWQAQLVAASSGDVSAEALADFLEQPQAVILEGRLITPRFLQPGQVVASGHPWRAFASQDFPRVGFLLLTPEMIVQAVLPVELYPEGFPYNEDVILLGCTSGGYVQVRLLFFPGAGMLYSSPPVTAPCEVP